MGKRQVTSLEFFGFSKDQAEKFKQETIEHFLNPRISQDVLESLVFTVHNHNVDVSDYNGSPMSYVRLVSTPPGSPHRLKAKDYLSDVLEGTNIGLQLLELESSVFGLGD